MACGCEKPEKTLLWSPIPEFNKPTTILPGENIDCYAKRAGTNGKNDVAEKEKNKIDNTSLVSDLNGNVNETFKLTPDSDKTASTWEIFTNGQTGTIANLQFDSSTGILSGTISDENAGKSYKVLIVAKDSSGQQIDSREFNFVPKKKQDAETAPTSSAVKFVFPYSPSGRVTCAFGPRNPPAPGASSMHKGIDISQPGSALGDILSAADGTVIKCGPARGFGNWIVIEHKDAQNTLVATTVYGHMNDIYVTTGQKVSAGQKIAKEGNAGIGSAAHLHFELHKGGLGNPVDPIPYINGQFSVAENNEPGKNGEPVESSFKSVNNSDRGLDSAETKTAPCAERPNNQAGDPGQPPLSEEPSEVPVKEETRTVQEIIQATLDSDSDLDDDDKKLLMFMAKIESNFNPSAKNPSSSARGLYQMLDKTAVHYYGKVGIPATTENRNNPEYATKAQIAFYKDQRKFWNEYRSSYNPGPGKIAGKSLQPAVNDRYKDYTKGEFIYGLIHHDGVGNAVSGKDMQGVDYYRKKIRSA